MAKGKGAAASAAMNMATAPATEIGSKAAAKAAANPPDYTVHKGKAATDLQRRFSQFIVDKVGVEFGTAKERTAFDEGVRLGVALRIPFQASPENQAARLAARNAAPEPKPEKAAKEPKAPTKKATKAAAPAAEEPTAETAEAKPAKPRAPRKTAPTKAQPF